VVEYKKEYKGMQIAYFIANSLKKAAGGPEVLSCVCRNQFGELWMVKSNPNNQRTLNNAIPSL
jgi:hypothetical protein